VHDKRRVSYLFNYLRSAQEAMAAGVPLLGYFVWSFLDNFEWAWGRSKRFGLVHVDYGSQRRVLKDSAIAYRDVIRSNGEILD
jgi:beta-glucosidase